MLTVEKIRVTYDHLDKRFPDQICACGNPDCGECASKFLLAEVERLRALLNDKDYIRLKADYNRGHLSHHGWLLERDGGLTE